MEKVVPGIFGNFFMQLPEGLKGNGFSVVFHFPETASRYSMTLGGFGEEGMGRAVLSEQGR